MPFVKGQPRPPGAGRKKGSTNAVQRDVAVTVHLEDGGTAKGLLPAHQVRGTVPIVLPTARALMVADIWGELQAIGCHPHLILAELAMGAESEGVRRLAASDLLDRLLPRLKAIEHRGLPSLGSGITPDALRQSVLDRLRGARSRLGTAEPIRSEPE